MAYDRSEIGIKIHELEQDLTVEGVLPPVGDVVDAAVKAGVCGRGKAREVLADLRSARSVRSEQQSLRTSDGELSEGLGELLRPIDELHRAIDSAKMLVGQAAAASLAELKASLGGIIADQPDLALALERRFGGEFEAERALSRQPSAVAGHLPDGILHIPDGRHVGIELELTQKSQRRLAAIMSGHAGNLTIDEVWYVIINDAMRPPLARAAADHPHIKIVRWAPPSRRSAPTSKTSVKQEL